MRRSRYILCWRLAAAITACLWILVACGPTPAVSSPATLTAAPTPGVTVPGEPTQEATLPISPTLPAPSSSGFDRQVSQAREDLAQRLGIDPGQIALVEVKPVVWPDGSLGCPQPGMEYTQVPVEGLLIRLRAEGQVYEYHSGGSGMPFLCEHPS